MTAVSRPGSEAKLPSGASRFSNRIPINSRYENWIGGEYVPPVNGQYFLNPSPVTGQPLCDVARSTPEDVELALDAAHAAALGWNTTSAAYRANILNRIADRLEENLESIAVIETIDNGKAIRETIDADLPLAIDHFRYFAGVLRAQEGGSPNSTTTPSPITSTSRSASSRRSFRGISRCSWRHGSLRRHSRPETASCSSRPSRRRFRSWRSWS